MNSNMPSRFITSARKLLEPRQSRRNDDIDKATPGITLGLEQPLTEGEAGLKSLLSSRTEASMVRLYRITSVAALVLFIALAFAHVLALMHLVNPPMGVLAAAAPLILFGQIVSILGLKGGSLKTQGSTRAFGRQWRLALRYIPNGWKIFGLPFWYAYVPVTFVYGMARAGGSVEEVAGKLVLTEHGRVIRALTEQEAFSSRADMFAGFSVILMAFAFAHFVLLRFVVPNRDAIIAERAP